MGERNTSKLSDALKGEPENGRAYWERQAAEQYGRKQAEEKPLLDPALAMEISKRLGPGFQHGYRPDRKHFIKTPFDVNLMGAYFSGQPTEPMQYPFADDAYSTKYDELMPQKDHLYEFGTKPSAKVLAHEYRHRAGVGSEYENRLYDAMYSQTPEDWNNAVKYYREQISDTYEDAQKMPFDEAERRLIGRLTDKQERNWLLSREYDSAPDGDKPVAFEEPSLGGFLVDLLLGQKGNFTQQDKLPFEKIPNTGPNKPEPLPPAERRGYPKRTNR